MDIDLARQMVRAALESGRILGALFVPLKQNLSAEDYQACARDLAEAIDKANSSLIARAIEAHPILQEEIEAAIRESGRY
jgi:hypothetical protein